MTDKLTISSRISLRRRKSSPSRVASIFRRNTSDSSLKSPEIGLPYDVQHVTHIGFDGESGQLVGEGVPQEWIDILLKEGIPIEDQAQNASVVAQVMKFYHTMDDDDGASFRSVESQALHTKKSTSRPISPAGGSTATIVMKKPPPPPEDPDDDDQADDSIDPREPLFVMVEVPPSPRHWAQTLTSQPHPSIPHPSSSLATKPEPRRASSQPVGTSEMLDALSRFVLSPERVQFLTNGVLARGGFGDVRQAMLKPANGKGPATMVAVKVLRFDQNTSIDRAKKSLAREAVTWAGLLHPNVVPFAGYHFHETELEAWLVCPWQQHGNVREYLASRINDPTERMSLVMGTAYGLAYLHSLDPSIVHGDIKSANVLVGHDRQPMLCDFGLAKVVDEGIKGFTSTTNFRGSIPWCSPELFNDGKRSAASDVWAWGWLVWEIVTGKFPFEGDTSPMVLMFKILTGKLPDLKTEAAFTSFPQLVEVLEWCWMSNPKLRMTMVDSRGLSRLRFGCGGLIACVIFVWLYAFFCAIGLAALPSFDYLFYLDSPIFNHTPTTLETSMESSRYPYTYQPSTSNSVPYYPYYEPASPPPGARPLPSLPTHGRHQSDQYPTQSSNQNQYGWGLKRPPSLVPTETSNDEPPSPRTSRRIGGGVTFSPQSTFYPYYEPTDDPPPPPPIKTFPQEQLDQGSANWPGAVLPPPSPSPPTPPPHSYPADPSNLLDTYDTTSSPTAYSPTSPTSTIGSTRGHRRARSSNDNSSTIKRRGIMSSVSDLFGFKRKRLEISTPYDPVHLVHVGFNNTTGEFTGLPKEWQQLLEESGISRSEQERNPQAVMEIVKFYQGQAALSSAPVPALLKSTKDDWVPIEWDQVDDLPHKISETENYLDEWTGPSASDPATPIDILEPLSKYIIPPSRLEFLKEEHVGHGGFGDVRRAMLAPITTGKTKSKAPRTMVAVKQLRFGGGILVDRAKKRFAREGLVWAGLDHPCILPFIGYYFDDEKVEAWLVCPWEANGNVADYLAKRPPLLRERIVLIADSTRGLNYLHTRTPAVVHGDIKAANVLVSDDPRALLCDFGLAKVVDGGKTGLTTTMTFKGSIPWCSRELFDGQQRTPASDVWAWGWLVWEILTGTPPFQGEKTHLAVMFKIVTGKLPNVETEPAFAMVPQLAALVRRCWDVDPSRRPTMADCIDVLENNWGRDGRPYPV